jgi:translocation and assembly module TamA
MVSVRLRHSCACFAMAALFLPPVPALSQVAVPTPGALDPTSPLAPMDDLGVAWPDPMAAEPALPGATRTATVDAAAEQRYRVVLDGLDKVGDARLRPRFDAASALMQGIGSPANVAQIERRAREDEDVLTELLRSYGYYDAAVTTRVQRDAATRHVVVTLVADAGALYRFADVTTPGLAAAGAKAGVLAEAFDIAPQQPVDAEKVIAAGDALRTALGRQGFAFGTVAEPDVVVDHASRTATLAIKVDPGAAQTFGAIRVAGTPLFSAGHLGRIARFEQGDPYDARLLEDYRRALIQTGLVSTVRAVPVAGGGGQQRRHPDHVGTRPAAHHCGHRRLWHGRGRVDRGELDASQPHRARRRADVARRAGHARAAGGRRLPPQQFPDARSGADRQRHRRAYQPQRL